MELISNIINNYNYLLSDFGKFSFNYISVLRFGLYILIPGILVLVFYLLGSKISYFLPKGAGKNAETFIDISLGYIAVCTTILILGMLGLFYLNLLYLFYTILILIALFPLSTLVRRLNKLSEIYKEFRVQFWEHKWINIAILSFILISFLRLIPPEIGVDAVWYHTDYPKMYIESHSMMSVDPKGKYYPAVTPTLSDMMYVFSQSISLKDLSRYIHFTFYLLVILVYLTVFRKRFKLIPYAVLLFVTSPIIIRVSSSAYAEFPWIFFWLLAAFLITSKDKHDFKDIILPGILVGAALATKLWMLPFFGAFFLYLLAVNISENKIKLFKLLTVSTILVFSIPFLWYLRAFLITGNPLFPTFWNYPDGSPNNPFTISNILSTFNLEGLRVRMLSLANISPFSIIGFIFILPYLTKISKSSIRKYPFFAFSAILTAVQIIINYSFHRFVIPFFSIIAVVLAFGIYKFININRIFKYSSAGLFFLLFFYYFVNTLLILPYGLGWANQSRYLSRILSRDNSSYYDFNNQFSKVLSNKDLVATYGLWGFYYADFKYMYTEDIFRKGQRSLLDLKKLGTTKLMILGNDINWLCKTEKLSDCSEDKYALLTSYKFPDVNSSQYLYEIK